MNSIANDLNISDFRLTNTSLIQFDITSLQQSLEQIVLRIEEVEKSASTSYPTIKCINKACISYNLITIN